MSKSSRKGKNWRRLRSEKRAKIKAYVSEYKAVTPCKDCGRIFHPVVMDFDHIGTDKKFNISRGVGTWRSIIAEMAKCELVCANCHRMRTFNRHGSMAAKRPEPDPQMSFEF